MNQESRREFLKWSALGAGAVLFPDLALGATASTGEPHFFLMIIANGGADSSYLFDARPLSMTKAGKIQNYLGEDPMPWIGLNGVTTLASSLTKPLHPYMNRFSVLNGVCMTPTFDGHLQNLNFMFTGNAFGGESFVPHLNLEETGRAPESLDGVLPTDAPIMDIANHASVVPLQAQSAANLAAKLRTVQAPKAGSETIDFVRARLSASASGTGRFAGASRLMLKGLEGAPEAHRKLERLSSPDTTASQERQAIGLIADCFRQSIARSAIYTLPERFDVHAAELAKDQPKIFASAVSRIADLLKGLSEIPYGRTRSIFDVTTVMIASEFGRTFRTEGQPIDRTGTNHDQFSNSILLGGKGIRPGLVIGASDLADEKAVASKAHLALDPKLEKAIGRPFEFATLKPRTDAPDTFDLRDQLTINSVVNSVYELFGVAKSRHRLIGRDLPVAPVLRGLLT